MKMTKEESAYSGRLEEATGFSIRTGKQDGDKCWWLVEPCGDDHGDPWFYFEDLMSDTLAVVERHERRAALTAWMSD